MARLRCGLIGWPVEHSLSPKLHAYAARSRGIDLSYELFPAENARDMGCLVYSLWGAGYTGLNITTPYKEAALALGRFDAEAEVEDLNAANLITLSDPDKLWLWNTDFSGFIEIIRESRDLLARDLPSMGGDDIAVIVGTGPAARAVTMALQEETSLTVHMLSRGGSSLNLVSPRSEPVQVLGYDRSALGEVLPNCRILINAGPASNPQLEEWISTGDLALNAATLFMDLNYRSQAQGLLESIRSAGLQTANGLTHLCYQAAHSFNIWTRSDVTGKELLDYLIAEGHDAALSNGR